MVIVGMVRKARIQDHIPALVTDQIFIVGGKEMEGAGAESSRAEVFVNQEVSSFPTIPEQFVAQG